MSHHSVIFSVLLIWAAFAGLVLSIIMSPHLIQNARVKVWRRTLYCVVLGPTVWMVVALAIGLAAIMFVVDCEKKRRAKKAVQS